MILVGSAAAGAAIGAVPWSPGSASGAATGAAIGALIGVILTALTNIAFANRDGIVAQDEFAFTDLALMNMTTSGGYSEQHHYPGTDSPGGCGSNSDYYVSWSLSRG